jgi:membrane protein insertase Oxa1/YidC/SpoIIIJ
MSVTNHDKPISFFRRFMEGWFSVYLSIFVVTLLIRILIFPLNTPLKTNVSRISKASKAHQLVRYGIARSIISSKFDLVHQNQVSFGNINELTVN